MHALAETGLGADQKLVLAWDIGKVWGEGSEFLSGHTLAGVAVGLRGALGRTKAINYEVLLAKPVVKPTDYQTGSFDLIANITWNF